MVGKPLGPPPNHLLPFHKCYLVVEIFPVVLRHQAKQGQKGPPKGVEAGVAVIGVPSRLQTVKPIRALSVTQTHRYQALYSVKLSEKPSSMVQKGRKCRIRTGRLKNMKQPLITKLSPNNKTLAGDKNRRSSHKN